MSVHVCRNLQEKDKPLKYKKHTWKNSEDIKKSIFKIDMWCLHLISVNEKCI